MCNYKNVLRWTKCGEPVICLLNERFTNTKYIYELLGVNGTAHRPEAATHSASHYYTVMVLVHITLSAFVVLLLVLQIRHLYR